MSTLRLQATLCPIWAGLMLAAGWQPSPAGAAPIAPAPGPAAATNALAVPKSVFAIELPNGKDPFFPLSERFKKRSAVATNGVVRMFSVLDQLTLKGISIGQQRRLALINNLTLAEGEKGPIRLNNQTNLIQCVEIRDNSVVVAAVETHERRELRLKN
jgi:hypothetical protein